MEEGRPTTGTAPITIETSVSNTAGEPLPPFQPMPPLSPEQLDALTADIGENGVLVPIVVDQHGRILDGHNRSAIAEKLGIPCPREVRHVADDDQAHDLAVTLNCARRHLTREQKREVIRAEAARRPGDSDRAIARRVGASPSTVAAVRRPEVSKLDTSQDTIAPKLLTREEAKELTAAIKTITAAKVEAVQIVCELAFMGGAEYPDVLSALLEGNAAEVRRHAHLPPEVGYVLNELVMMPLVDWLTNEDVRALIAVKLEKRLALGMPPMPPEVLAIVLDLLADRIAPWQARSRGLNAWLTDNWSTFEEVQL
jgi:transposase